MELVRRILDAWDVLLGRRSTCRVVELAYLREWASHMQCELEDERGKRRRAEAVERMMTAEAQSMFEQLKLAERGQHRLQWMVRDLQDRLDARGPA